MDFNMNWYQQLKDSAKGLKAEIIPIYYALLDKRTPLIAKIFAGITVAYLISPIDLIPDFIPVLGILDDLIIIPILIKITIGFIPKNLIEEIKNNKDLKIKLGKSWWFALPIILLYSYLLYLLISYFI